MIDDIDFIRIWEGENVMIDAVQINKNCSVSDFLEELPEQEYKRVFALFKLLDQSLSTSKSKKLRFTCEGCFEFKPTSQLRISFIYLKQSQLHQHICLLDGFRKRKRKWPKNEIKKTIKLCKKVREYENNKGKTYV